MTVLKTRFIREDNPDIIGIGGDVRLFKLYRKIRHVMDISIPRARKILKKRHTKKLINLEICSGKETYAVPYVAKCNKILYNKESNFEEHG